MNKYFHTVSFLFRRYSNWTLISGIVGMVSFVILLALTLSNEYQSFSDHAQLEVENMSQMLDEEVMATVNKADLLLREVQRDVLPEDMQAAQFRKDTRKQKMHALMKSQVDSVAEVEILNVIDTNGDYIYSSIDPLPNINIADRDYFIRERDNASTGLIISPPLISHRTGKWTIILSRRLNFTDGRFAGVVIAVLNLNYFEEYFRSLNLGPNGVIALYDINYHLVSRFPPIEKDLGKTANLNAKPFIEKGIKHATYVAKAPLDGIERIFSFRQVGDLPFIVFAGIARDDYLGEWHQHIWQYSLGALLFCALIIWFGIFQRRSEKEFRIAATAFETQEGMAITDANANILRVNKEFANITGYSAEEVIGKNPRILSSGQHDKAFYASMWESINNIGSWRGEIWNRRKNGEVYPEHLTVTAVKGTDGKVSNYVATLNDISMSKAAEDRIKHLAFYDPLTLLPNRRLMLDRLRQALVSIERSGQTGALLFIDLDNFKTLNDTLGHDIGDLLLKQVAQRLESCVREGDTVARLGGDEFVVMLEDLSVDPEEAAEQTELIGRKILFSINQTYQLGTHEYNNTPSIGATLFNNKAQSADDVMKQADIAMYQSKKAGRNTLRFFDPHMQEAVDARASLEADLRLALEKNELEVYFQPIVESKTGKINKAEALLRWKHPKRGMISPATFIPVAEESGLILEIGEWVFMEAINTIEYWKQETGQLIQVSVNKSPVQFVRAERHPWLERLANSKLPKGCITVEITEGLLITDSDKVREELLTFQKKGIEVSIDDFGTGFSSLSYLNQFHIDYLKIDISFIKSIVENESNRALTEAIIVMAHKLGIKTIAEGVETEAQSDLLIQFGCDYFQGFLYSKAVTATEFMKLLGA